MQLRALGAGLALALAATSLGAQAPASPQLRCEVTYAGTTHTVRATPVASPYDVPSVDIGGRFHFKPVMVGQGQRVEYIKLYSYLDTRKGPLLVQAVRYLPPFAAPQPGHTEANLTGAQFLYAGPVERELQYQCFVQGVQP